MQRRMSTENSICIRNNVSVYKAKACFVEQTISIYSTTTTTKYMHIL